MPRKPTELVGSRLDAIRTSPALELAGIAARLRAQGKDVIAFGAGEPDLPTPPAVQEAAIAAIRENLGRYTPSAGLMELREAIAARLTATGLPYAANQVCCASGAKSALYQAFYVFLEPGDEVVFPAPFWNSYEDIIAAAGGVAKPFPTSAETGFQLDPDALEAALSPRTRAVLVNSPNNPTGTVYTEAALRGVAEVVRKHDLVVVTDDIYEHLVYGDAEYKNVLHVAPELADQTIVINGFSKSHSMTGWRLGYAAGPADFISAVARLQSQIAGNPNSIAQRAAIGGLTAPIDPERRELFDRRRKLMLREIRSIPNVSCPEPHGAFYAFPDVSAYFGRRFDGTLVDSSQTLVRLLLEECLVASIPGEVFGAPGHVRFSYACGEDVIREGVRRVREFLTSLDD